MLKYKLFLTFNHSFIITSIRYRSSEDERAQKDEKKSKKKKKKDDKSKKKSKKSKKSKKTKKSKNKKDSKKKKKKKKVSSSSESSDDSSESSASDAEGEVWVEKSADGQFKRPDAVKSKSKKGEKDDGDDESQVGPSVRNTSGLSHKDFGHALLPGEGAAMVSVLMNLLTHRLNITFKYIYAIFINFLYRRLTLLKANVFQEEVKLV